MANKQYIEKTKILNEIKSRLKCVRDPYEHNIHTNRLEEVYEDGKNPFWYLTKDEFSEVVDSRPNKL